MAFWYSGLIAQLCETKLVALMFFQNPPAIPTLPMAWLYCLLRNCSLVVDWHNYSYSILALALGARHPLVRMTHWYGLPADGPWPTTTECSRTLFSYNCEGQ